VKKIDKDFLVSEYWRYVEEFDRYPYFKDIKNNPNYPSDTPYKRMWSSWGDFLKEIEVIRQDCKDGWIIYDEELLNKHYENQSILPEYIMIKLNFWKSWSVIKQKASKMGLSRKSGVKSLFTNEFLINEIKRYYNMYKKVPTCEDFDENKNFIYSSRSIRKRFGSWNSVIKLAGLDVNLTRYHTKYDILSDAKDFYTENKRSPFYNELGYSRTLTYNYWREWDNMLQEANLPPTPKTFGVFTEDKNGKTHRSRIEASISNVLIDNGIEFTTDEPYSNFMNINTKNYLFDWVFDYDDDSIFVEYFGLNTNYNRSEIDEYKNKMYDKISLCIESNLKLVSLNQNDLVGNFDGLVKKFERVGVILNVEQDHVDLIGYKIKKISVVS